MIRVPLSLVQEEMWVLRARSAPGTYNDTVRHRLDGPFDEPALRAALAWLIDRHEPLRTRFATAADGEVYQSIEPTVTPPLEVVDLRARPAPDRAAALAERLAAQAATPFDASIAPLFTVAAHLVGDRGAELAITADHLIHDETSLAILVSELDSAYRAYAAGTAPDCPPLPIQYADYAVWQRRSFTPARLDRERDYWRRTLAGMPAQHGLKPVDPPPAAETGHHPPPLAVQGDAYAALRRVARATGATPFAVCAAAVGALLAEATGQTDCVLITTVSSRDRVELERAIGDFANVALLRTDLSGDPAFAVAVGRVTDALVGLFEHRALPFAWVWEAVLADRRAAGITAAPQPPVGVEYFPASRHRWAPGVTVVAPAGADEHVDPSMGPLTFTLYDYGEGLWGRVRYDPAFLDRLDAETLAGDFVALLAAATSQPERRLSELSLLRHRRFAAFP